MSYYNIGQYAGYNSNPYTFGANPFTNFNNPYYGYDSAYASNFCSGLNLFPFGYMPDFSGYNFLNSSPRISTPATGYNFGSSSGFGTSFNSSAFSSVGNIGGFGSYGNYNFIGASNPTNLSAIHNNIILPHIILQV